MSDELRFILSMGIVPAVLICLIRFRKIDPSYYPFVYNVLLVLLVEVIIWVLKIARLSNPNPSINTVQNIFSFLDIYFFTWLFHNWGLFNHKKKVFLFTVIAFFLAWFVLNIVVYSINRYNLYFLGLYSFVLVFFSITTFGKVIIQDRRNLFTNARFWICLGIIVFYTFFIIVCTTQISIFNIHVSTSFQNNLQRIIAYCNLLTNLLYAVAALWIPRKKNFINLS